MRVSEEMKGNIKNLEYYIQQVDTLARRQLEIDFERGEQQGIDMNAKAAAARFEALGSIQSSCKWLQIYLHHVTMNFKKAEEQEKLIFGSEEEQ